MPLLNNLGLIELTDQKVKLNPYKPRPLKPVQMMTDQELIDNVGTDLVVDTEKFQNYFLIAFKSIKLQKYRALELPFNERELSWIMHNYRTIGFNSIKYDLGMIWLSFLLTNNNLTSALAELQDLSDALIFENLWPKKAETDFNFKIYPTAHIDLIEVCPLRGSLKLYGARLHSPRIQDLPFSVNKPLTDAEKHLTKHYCFNDLDNTELAFSNLTEQLKLRTDLSAQYRSDLMSKSDAQIAESVIGNEIKSKTGYWPKKPEIDTQYSYHFNVPRNLAFQTPYMKGILDQISKIKFSVEDTGRLAPSEVNKIRIQIGNSIYRMGIGGLHSSEECRAIKSDENNILKDIDVESYYPAIVINQRLYPRHIGEIFVDVYTGIRDRRVDAKRNKRIAESENLKVTINGTFGKTGSPYSFLYAPEMTIQITVGGQLYLLMFIELLELNHIPVVSANTDGILVHCPKDKIDLLTKLTKQWEQFTGFKTEETEYEAVYSRDVNAYLAVKRDKEGKIEFKGKNDYYDPWRGKSAKDKYWRFQKNPTHQICVEAIERLIAENKPIEETIKECVDITKFVCIKNVKGGAHKNGDYLGKVVRWYYAKDTIGTINYVASNNKVPESDGAKPCLDLPESFPEDVDYKRYIEITMNMLYDCGYYKRPGQLKFF